MSILSISGLTKIYPNNRKALDDINLEIETGSFVGLLGPNGAGKSTLINIISGLVNKTAGRIILNGYDFDLENKKAKLSIGVVPQEVALDPFFTIYEMLEIYAGYYGIPKSKRKTKDLIEVLGLSDKANSKPRALSGGMKRRLLIAKALVHNPKIVILDEPTAGVDIKLREQMWSYIKELNQNGTTIIMTTHYLEEAEELCNNISIINQGKIITSDTKQNLLHILDNKKVIVTLRDKISQIPEAWKDLTVTQISDTSISISYKKTEISIGNIISRVNQTGNEILDINTTDVDLHDVFNYYTSNN